MAGAYARGAGGGCMARGRLSGEGTAGPGGPRRVAASVLGATATHRLRGPPQTRPVEVLPPPGKEQLDGRVALRDRGEPGEDSPARLRLPRSPPPALRVRRLGEGGAPRTGAGTGDLRNEAGRGGGARGAPGAGSREGTREPKTVALSRRGEPRRTPFRAHQYPVTA